MTLLKPIPFFANTKDNLRCYQAVIRMVFKYFEPEKDYTWEQLDQFTARVSGKGTWPTQSFIKLDKRGYQLNFMDDFDNHRFIKDGGKYLLERFGQEVGQSQIEMSDIPQEQKIMQQFVRLFSCPPKIPTLKDIQEYFQLGYLIICNLNYSPLYNRSGYSGHFVLVYDIDDKYIYLHDPGLPPNPSAKIPIKRFLKAWEYPNHHSRNLCALRLKP